ncbi:MAG: hypothetical protein ACI4QZ_01850 [Eubacteriales bacterium]
MKFSVTVYIGGKKVSDTELSEYTIFSKAVDLIVNSVADRNFALCGGVKKAS